MVPTSRRSAVIDWLLIGLLILAGFIVGVLSVAFVTVYLGTVAFPISALIGAVVNCVLLWRLAPLAGTPLRFGALAAWALAVIIALFGGPGGDVLLYNDWRTGLLVILGAGMPAVLTWFGKLPKAEDFGAVSSAHSDRTASNNRPR